MVYSEQELESERCIDDDYNLINHYYVGKSRHPNLPFYLQDERGETFEFKWDLIYQYLARLTHD